MALKEPIHLDTLCEKSPGVVGVLMVLSSRSGRPGLMSLKRLMVHEAPKQKSKREFAECCNNVDFYVDILTLFLETH